MSLITADRVKETTTVVGTGTITLLGASTGFQSFAAIGNGNTCYYAIASVDGTYWETGIGTYTLSGTTLARTTVLASSNAGALVNFIAGIKEVFVTYPASKSVFTDSIGCINTVGSSPYPTIRPSLNLDFANSKQLDPRVTFSRLSTATYYDGQTTAKAEENLLKGSNDFGNSTYWTPTNASTPVTGITAPDGTSTAYIFAATAANATLYQTLTTGALPYTLTLYIQRVTGTGTVNLTLDGTTLTPQTTTASWVRYSLPNVTPTAASHTIGLQLAVSGDVVNIWGAQLEQRSSATAYTPTTTAPITNYIPQLMTAPAGIARFDHEPLTGKSLGLLIEEGRSNLLTNSLGYSTPTNTTKISNCVIALDGSQTASLYVTDTNLSGHFVASYASVSSGVANTSFTYSTYISNKGITACQIWLYANSNTGDRVIASFDVSLVDPRVSITSTNTVTVPTANINYTSTPVGNGWFRLTVTGMFTAVPISIGFTQTIGNTSGAIGNNYAGAILWGAQLEAGSFATSYIPTTTAAVTRSADQASMTGVNFSSWYNQAQGSFYLDFEVARQAVGAEFLLYCANNIRLLYIGGSSTNLVMYDGVTPYYATSVQNNLSYGAGVFHKTMSAYTTTTNTLVTDSSSPFTASFISASQATGIYINSVSGGYFNGHIRKLSYYPKALSTTELQALTS